MTAITALTVMAIALLGWGIHLAWRWWETRAFAPDVLAARQRNGDLPETVNTDEFADLYTRAEGPRAGTYMFVCATIIVALIAPFTVFVNFIWRSIWLALGAPPVFAVNTLVHTFFLFVIIMGFMIAVLAAALRRYYTLAPPNLKQIIRDLGGNPR